VKGAEKDIVTRELPPGVRPEVPIVPAKETPKRKRSKKTSESGGPAEKKRRRPRKKGT
jgi:hypothetical protein